MSKDIYIELFHGRKDPECAMDDWGTEGPILGPFPFCHITYMGGFLKLGDDAVLNCYKDMVYYDGVFYGDFSILSGLSASRDPILMGRCEKLDLGKAAIPKQQQPKDQRYHVEVSRHYSRKGSVVVTAESPEGAQEEALETDKRYRAEAGRTHSGHR